MSDDSKNHAAHLNRPTHVRWIILAILFVASFVAYVLRTNMSIAGENMMTDLGISTIQFGMVLAAFGLLGSNMRLLLLSEPTACKVS